VDLGERFFVICLGYSERPTGRVIVIHRVLNTLSPLSNDNMASAINASAPNFQEMIKGGLRAAKAVARDRGVSDVTLWRWQRRGWIKAVNICGRVYVCLDSLAEFDRRAAAGEFARGPVGAAAASVKARMEKESLKGAA
jgi:hypothetical protein